MRKARGRGGVDLEARALGVLTHLSSVFVVMLETILLHTRPLGFPAQNIYLHVLICIYVMCVCV